MSTYGYCGGQEHVERLSGKLGTMQERVQRASCSVRSEAKHMLTCPCVAIDEDWLCTTMVEVTVRPFVVGAYASVKSVFSGRLVFRGDMANALRKMVCYSG